MERTIKAVFTIVEDGRASRPIFRRIGTGFVNKDESLNIYLDALPVSGKLHIRDIDTKRHTDGAQQEAA